MSTREMICPYCKHRLYVDAPDPIYCGPNRASVGHNEYSRVQMVERKFFPPSADHTDNRSG